MIKQEREQVILSLLDTRAIVSVHQVYAAIPDISQVTLRRDIAHLARTGKLERVHGGIKRIASETASSEEVQSGLDPDLVDTIAADLEFARDEDIQGLQNVDAIVLPPIEGRLAKTIHYHAARHDVFCLEESSPGGGLNYLGIDNERAGYDLGCLVAQDFVRSGLEPYCLLVGAPGQKNTKDRAAAFLRGLQESFPRKVDSVSVDGNGIYTRAFRQARDALSARPEVNVIFGINDHSILAALDAARALRRTDIAAYCVGGEGSSLFEEFEEHGMLRGFVAMFPEVVARSAVNAISHYFTTNEDNSPVITPYRVISWDNVADYYRKEADGKWRLQPAVLEELAPLGPVSVSRGHKHSVLCIMHYSTHEWYQTLSQEMRKACETVGYDYHTASVKSQVLNALDRTRQEIGRRASELLRPGDTIIINGGAVSLEFAKALSEHKALTVITNSLSVLEVLVKNSGIKIILTGGSYRASSRDLVGPNMVESLKSLRIDCAFLAVDGLTTDFGASCIDEQDAECVRIFAEGSRKCVLLADHSILGEDTNYRAIALEKIDEIVSDFGVPASERIDYTSRGVGIILAEDTPVPSRAS